MYHGASSNEDPLRPLFSQPAALAFLVTIAVCRLVGEVPPLSRFEMYADLDPARTTAVLQLRADGVPADPSSLERFSGDELTELPLPRGVPCTMRWFRDDARTFILDHRAASDAPGPVTLEWGYVVVGWRDGAVHELSPFVTLARGRAWQR